jgi:UPF0755 protein
MSNSPKPIKFLEHSSRYHEERPAKPFTPGRFQVKKIAAVFLTVIGMVIVSLSLVITPPSNMPEEVVITIEEGWSVRQTAAYLKEQSTIRSAFVFRVLAKLSGRERDLVAGSYSIREQPSVYHIFTRLIKGEYHMVPVRVTIPEGWTVKQIAEALDRNLPNFKASKFLDLAQDKEGYLFPDTYFFRPNSTEQDVIRIMNENFEKKLAHLSDDIATSGRSLHEIMTMASIIEGEARTMESRKMIADILWKRFDIDMPLQVDVVFPYIMGKNTFELTLADLRVDSPYNTYRYKGLPPGPINNPGLNAITATLSPTKNNYWYYLSDMQGGMHYARNHDQHVVNKQRYLR